MVEILAITRTGDICLTVFLFLVGLVLIIKGGDWFVDSASKIAEMSGVPQFIIGANTFKSFPFTPAAFCEKRKGAGTRRINCGSESYGCRRMQWAKRNRWYCLL